MTDLGTLHHFLGIAVSRSTNSLFLSQRQYILDLLSRAGMSDCQPSRTPADVGTKLSADGDPIPDPSLYHSITGALQYSTLSADIRGRTCLMLYTGGVCVALIKPCTQIE